MAGTDAASHVYAPGLQAVCGVHASLATANWKAIAVGSYAGYWHCALFTAPSTYTTDTYASTNATETTNTSGSAYNAGGQEIDGSGHNQFSSEMMSTQTYVEFESNQTDSTPQWTSASFSAAWAMVMPYSTALSNSPIVASFTLGGTKTVTSGTFTLTFATDHSSTHGSVFNLAIQ